MFVVAAVLLGTIALLATLQYRWLGKISDAERERMTSNLGTHSAQFAQEFDREVTRAYLTFQVEALGEGENVATRLAAAHDSWNSRARYPRMIKEIYIASRDADGQRLRRFDLTSRFIEPVEWPAHLVPIRGAFAAESSGTGRTGTFVFRSMPGAVWEQVPAVVVPTPVLFFNERVAATPQRPETLRMAPHMSFTILVLDREYITAEMLPALVQQFFRSGGSSPDYQVAVVKASGDDVIYKSHAAFVPAEATKPDGSAELFQVRLQEFRSLATDVRRFTTTIAGKPSGASVQHRETYTHILPRDNAPVSIVVQQGVKAVDRPALISGASGTVTKSDGGGARWKVLVKHPSGSLEAAVNAARRRNLMVSSTVLAMLGISVGFLVVTTRRAQQLAQQQMEFVAAVSHELRTPLAVIRSAADNLAEGVVHDQTQVRRYGELVRGEGRRLTEMVEQILELAGIQSGQRSFALRPVPVIPALHDVVRSSATLIEAARLDVEFDLPETLPPVLGDEQGLRRVWQNLIGNAIKYGARGGWIGIRARSSGKEVIVSVADKGIGIAAAEQSKIFEPFYRAPSVIAEQIQGAGLGLSLVQRIVEAHGGRITVQSTEGIGSEFTVHLPAASEEPVTRHASAHDAASLPTH